MLAKALTFRPRSGQATVESVLTLFLVLLLFLALFGISDQIRTKLLVENAAVKCARAQAVGYNEFMLRKIARLATMPAAGKCLTPNDGGGTLSMYSRYGKIGPYLMSEYEAQANAILNFEYWGGSTTVSTSFDNPISEATVTQHRPVPFWFGVLIGGMKRKCCDRADISATAISEAHYPDYLE